MAVDEAVARIVGRGEAPPTLRVYRWDPPCVSLGYFQRYEEVNLKECQRRGLDVVRRPTGGRAVVHHHEVTYSVCLATTHVPEGVIQSYVYLSRGLLEAYRYLGADATLAPGRRHSGLSAACFDLSSVQEILVNGRKAIGSAQVRKWEALLQHGSLPLRFDSQVVSSVLTHDAEAAMRLGRVLSARAIDLEEALGRVPEPQEVEEALRVGFEKGLGIELVYGELTREEEELSLRLEAKKYGNLAWNEARQAEEGVNCSI
jgi:lipoate-protein ligase A